MIEFVLYAILFILIGWTLVSFFLVWNWFDARDRLFGSVCVSLSFSLPSPS